MLCVQVIQKNYVKYVWRSLQPAILLKMEGILTGIFKSFDH